MSEYARETAGAFAQARGCFEETEAWLASAEAAALTHAELEDHLATGGGRPRGGLRTPAEGRPRGRRSRCWGGPARAGEWGGAGTRCAGPPPRPQRETGTSWLPACRRARNTPASGWPSWPACTTPNHSPAPPRTSSPRPAGRTSSAAGGRRPPGNG